jgi:hypothetical protein
MIWNFQIVIELILGIITLILGGYGVSVAWSIFRDNKGENGVESRTIEKKYYLLSMIALILLISRIINVIYFYFVITSLIPVIPGAMCQFGVLEASPLYSGYWDLGMKIFLPFLYGAFLLLDGVNKKTKSLILTPKMAKIYTFLMFPALVLDSGLDWIYFGFLEKIEVNCCRSVFNESTAFEPIQLLGPETAFLILLATLVVVLVISALQTLKDYKSRYLLLTTILAVIAVPLTILSIQEWIAPYFIFASKSYYGQPLGAAHHCPFCLLKRWWTMVPFMLTIWLGLATVGWQLILQRTSPENEEISTITDPMIDRLRKISILSILSGIGIVVIHILLFLFLDLP